MFQEKGYEVVRNVISKETAKILASQLHLLAKVTFDGVENIGDEQVPGAPAIYGTPTTDGLLYPLLPIMQRTTGMLLYPTYTYFRVYGKGQDMKRHTDRKACEFSMTLNLHNDPEPWAIYIEGTDKVETSVLLEPGDAMIYRGMQCPHWRNTYTGNMQIQVFLHYVGQQGRCFNHKFDKRKSLGTEFVS